jgi:hypothetical protein
MGQTCCSNLAETANEVTHTAQPKDTRTDDIIAQVDTKHVVMMQSLARGFLARTRVEKIKN